MRFARPIAAAIALALFVAACGSDPTESATEETAFAVDDLVTPEDAPTTTPARGVAADDAYVFQLFDGSEVGLSAFAGRPVVVNVWATWCPACVHEMPDFEAVHKEFGDDVVFIGVDTEDNHQDAVEFANEIGVTYLLADDESGELARALGTIGMPHTVIFDADGETADVHTGTLTADLLREKIESAQAAAN